jgi:hypothetical protein
MTATPRYAVVTLLLLLASFASQVTAQSAPPERLTAAEKTAVFEAFGTVPRLQRAAESPLREGERLRDQLLPEWGKRPDRERFQAEAAAVYVSAAISDTHITPQAGRALNVFLGTASGKQIAAALASDGSRPLVSEPSPERVALLKRIDVALGLTLADLTELKTMYAAETSLAALARDLKSKPEQYSDQIFVGYVDLDPAHLDSSAYGQVARRFAGMDDAQLVAALDFLESAPAREAFGAMAVAPARAIFNAWQMSAVVVARARSAGYPDAAGAAPVVSNQPYMPAEYRDMDPEDPRMPNGLRELARSLARQRAATINPESVLEVAEAAISSGDRSALETAAVALRQAHAGRESDFKLTLARGWVEMRRAMVDVPRGSRLWLYNDTQLAEGAKWLEQAVALQPEDAAALLALGYAKFLERDFDGAEAMYRRVKDPGKHGALLDLRLGDLAHARGDLDAAAQRHSSALTNPEDPFQARVAFFALALGDARPTNWSRIEPLLDHYLNEHRGAGLESAWYADAAWRAGNDPIAAQRRIEAVPVARRFAYLNRILAETLVMQAAREPLLAGALTPTAKRLLDEAASHYDLRDVAISIADNAQGAKALTTLYFHGFDVAEAHNNTSPVTVAFGNHHYDAVGQLIALGIDIDATPGLPLLHQAVMERQPALVRQLLERGADPRARDAMGRNAREVLGTETTPVAVEIIALLDGTAK